MLASCRQYFRAWDLSKAWGRWQKEGLQTDEDVMRISSPEDMGVCVPIDVRTKVAAYALARRSGLLDQHSRTPREYLSNIKSAEDLPSTVHEVVRIQFNFAPQDSPGFFLLHRNI